MRLEALLTPLSLEALKEAIVVGRPVHVAGDTTKFEGLFSLDALWETAALGRREGASFPRASLGSHQLPLAFDARSIERAVRSGNSVCIRHLDQASEPLRRLCVEAEQVLGFPGVACVHCYYSPSGTGYSFFHVDAGTAVTFQIAGRKTWLHARSAALNWPMRVGAYRDEALEWFGPEDWAPEAGSFQSPEEQEIVETSLSTGDVLIMPAGVWHGARADGGESLSLNLKLTPTPLIESVFADLRKDCVKDENWRAPLPFASLDELEAGAPGEDTLRKLRDHLIDLSNRVLAFADDGAALHRLWARNFLGSQDAPTPGANAEFGPNDMLEIPSGMHPRLVLTTGATSLIGQGRIIHFSDSSVGDLLKDLVKHRQFSSAEVEGWTSAVLYSPEALRGLLRGLVHAGFIRVSPPPLND